MDESAHVLSGKHALVLDGGAIAAGPIPPRSA